MFQACMAYVFQKVTFWLAKGNLLEGKRSSFGGQKTAFCNALVIKALQKGLKTGFERVKKHDGKGEKEECRDNEKTRHTAVPAISISGFRILAHSQSRPHFLRLPNPLPYFINACLQV